MEKLDIEKIRKLINSEKIRWTNHVVIRLLQRNITQEDVKNVLINGEIIEEYESDYPYTSCLVYGVNFKNKVIHVVCGSNGEELWIITAYYPDNFEWEENKKKRRETD